jgi:hypothetical protein
MKLRFLREGDFLDDRQTLLVRSGELDGALLREDAMRYRDIYGTCGVSVFALRGITLYEIAQQAPLVRFEQLTLLKAGDVLIARLRLEPTGRNPRHFTIAFDDLDEGIRCLTSCCHEVVLNPYHDE